MEESKEQKKIRTELDSQWLDRILDTCEEVGFTKSVVERFIHYYVPERRKTNARPTTSSSRIKSTSN